MGVSDGCCLTLVIKSLTDIVNHPVNSHRRHPPPKFTLVWVPEFLTVAIRLILTQTHSLYLTVLFDWMPQCATGGLIQFLSIIVKCSQWINILLLDLLTSKKAIVSRLVCSWCLVKTTLDVVSARVALPQLLLKIERALEDTKLSNEVWILNWHRSTDNWTPASG